MTLELVFLVTFTITIAMLCLGALCLFALIILTMKILKSLPSPPLIWQWTIIRGLDVKVFFLLREKMRTSLKT